MSKFNPSEEQQALINAVLNTDDDRMVICRSGAGTGKSFVLQQMFKAYDHNFNHGVFLSYGRDIADENNEHLPDGIKGMSFHAFVLSLLFSYDTTYSNRNKISVPTEKVSGIRYKINADGVSLKQIQELVTPLFGKQPKKVIKIIRDSFNEYCLTRHINISDYIEAYSKHILDLVGDDDRLKSTILPMVKKTIGLLIIKMMDKDIDITFDGCAKIVQSLMNSGAIKYSTDIAIIDELQDVNSTFREIFIMLDAKKKVAIGDKEQEIMEFALPSLEESAYDRLEQEPHVRADLHESFRCSKEIAEKVQEFMQENYDETYTFIGKGKKSNTGMNSLIMTRTNSEIVRIAIDATTLGVNVRSLRPTSSLFSIPMFILFGAKNEYEYRNNNGGKKSKYWKKDNQNILDFYHVYLDEQARAKEKMAEILKTYGKKVFNFPVNILAKYNDLATQCTKSFSWFLMSKKNSLSRIEKSAVEIAREYNYKDIKQAKEALDKNKDNKDCIQISTCHSMKGQSANYVYLSNGLNESTKRAIESSTDLSEIFLYLVGSTRARVQLFNDVLLGGDECSVKNFLITFNGISTNY